MSFIITYSTWREKKTTRNNVMIKSCLILIYCTVLYCSKLGFYILRPFKRLLPFSISLFLKDMIQSIPPILVTALCPHQLVSVLLLQLFPASRSQLQKVMTATPQRNVNPNPPKVALFVSLPATPPSSPPQTLPACCHQAAITGPWRGVWSE